MRIFAFIEGEVVIEKILKHLGLWDIKGRPPPKVKAPSLTISTAALIALAEGNLMKNPSIVSVKSLHRCSSSGKVICSSLRTSFFNPATITAKDSRSLARSFRS